MSVVLSLGAVLLTQQTKTFRVPMFNFDTKAKVSTGFYPALLPAGFKETGFGEGNLSSVDGTISITVSKSSGPIPAAQRNPNAPKDEEWTTIRLTNWIGYRNWIKSSEVYVLNWTRYRLNVILKPKTKKNLPTLRKSLNQIVDSLSVK
jgi:hypothetical protein